MNTNSQREDGAQPPTARPPMKVSYIYWEPWFGGQKPWFSLDGRAEITFGYDGFFSAEVVVAHAPSLLARGYRDHVQRLRQNAPDSQIWLLESAESAANYPAQFEPAFRGLFDAEISYRQAAEIWTPYLSPEHFVRYHSCVTDGREELCCAFISSAVNKSGRRQYLEDLMRHMDIASYGRVLNNRTVDGDRGRESKLAVMREFRFTLAFENAIETDYVTEKFFEPLMTGTVPIYLGAPNVDEFAPGADCYVDAAQFPDAAALADFIRREDPRRFHRWRQAPLKPAFLAKLERTSVPFPSRFLNLVERLSIARRKKRVNQPL